MPDVCCSVAVDIGKYVWLCDFVREDSTRISAVVLFAQTHQEEDCGGFVDRVSKIETAIVGTAPRLYAKS